MTLGERIKQERVRLGFTQDDFSGFAGKRKGAQVNWEKNESAPNANVLAAWSDKGADIQYIVTGTRTNAYPTIVTDGEVAEAPAHAYRTDTVEVPLYDVELSAGHGAALQDEQIIDTYTYKKDFIKQIGCDPEHLAIAFVRGDSMEPTLFDGDKALYDTRVQWFISEGIYAVRYDDRLMVKRLEKMLDGSIKIISDNDRYDPIIVTESTQHGFGVLGYLVDFSRSSKTCYRGSST